MIISFVEALIYMLSSITKKGEIESATNPRVVLAINNNIYHWTNSYLRIISEKFDDMGMEMSEEVDPSKC